MGSRVQRLVSKEAGLRWPVYLCGFGVGVAAVALIVAPHKAVAAAGQTWTPFVLVVGLLLVGLVAQNDGLFDALGSRLAQLPTSSRAFVAGASLLVAGVTATLNLDTSVVFLTPLLVVAARGRGQSEGVLLAVSILMANASSLFLPGSNLTNLIVTGGKTSGLSFFETMWPVAVSASVVTGILLCLPVESGAHPIPSKDRTTRRGSLGALAVLAVLGLVFVLSNAAIAVCCVGAVVAAVRVCQRRLGLQRVIDVVGLPTLVGLFGLALAAGTLGRAWAGPGQVVHQAGPVGTAVFAAACALVINNLPASALLAAHHPGSSAALLIGLNLGPNLAVTGSLAWVLWSRAARGAGATPSAREVARLGVVIVPLSMAAALTALWLS